MTFIFNLTLTRRKLIAPLLTLAIFAIINLARAGNYANTVTNTPGLLGYWHFDPILKTNSVVNGYSGTLFGNAKIGPPGSGAPIANDPANQGLLLDGQSSYFVTTLAGRITNSGTTMAWVYVTNSPSAAGHIFQITSEAQVANDFDFQIQQDNLLYFFTDNGSATVSPQTVPVNQWHMLAATFVANGNRVLYVDGVGVATNTAGNHSADTSYYTMGENLNYQGRYFEGTLAEVAVYDRALTGAEIAAIYDAGTPDIIITNQPNGYVVYGQNTNLSVSVSSPTPVSYQWYFVPLNPDQAAQAGAYAQIINGFVYNVVVTNGGFGYGNIPNILFAGGGGSGAGASASVSNGVVTNIAVTNAGTEYTTAPSVVIDLPNGWLFGQTNSTLAITNANQNSLGTYYVVVSNSAGSVTSSVVNLTLLYPPSITNQPQDQIASAYGTVSFDVGASGTGPLSYQWLFQSTNLLDTDASTLIVTNVTPQNLGTYAVIITNDYGSVTSSVANLYMYPYLETPFTGEITYWGQTNTLTVGAWGSGNLAYQWYFNGAAISGATSSNLVLSGIQFTNAGLYSVVVTNSYGSATNTPEEVVVNPANVSLGLFAGVIIQGTVGYNYTIQGATNLSDPNSWMTLTNLTLTAPVQIWSDYSVDVHTSPQKFYRILPGQ